MPSDILTGSQDKGLDIFEDQFAHHKELINLVSHCCLCSRETYDLGGKRTLMLGMPVSGNRIPRSLAVVGVWGDFLGFT